MIDIINDQNINDTKDKTIEVIFINKEGKIEISFKKETPELVKINNQYTYLNYHEDYLYYFIIKKKLAEKEEIDDIKKERNTIKLAKILANNQYITILNLEYKIYNFLDLPSDTLIITNKEINKQQLEAIKKIKNLLHPIKLITLDNNKEIEIEYNELINMFEKNKEGRIK